MELDNYELTEQRVRVLQEITELQQSLLILKENPEYIFSLQKMQGVFFKVKDTVYILTNTNNNINALAAIMPFSEGLYKVIFKVLEDKSIEYYQTEQGKIDALDMFMSYIINNTHVILHELVHIDDEKNGIIRLYDKSINSDPYLYYNHPSEVRAYTQENLYIMCNEITEAITKGEITTKIDLNNFCRIYRDYKKIFKEANTKNNFFYWKSDVFSDYLKNLDFMIEVIGQQLPN